MNDYWHIPRASLSSSSAASIASSSNRSHRSHSNPAMSSQQQQHALKQNLALYQQRHQQQPPRMHGPERELIGVDVVGVRASTGHAVDDVVGSRVGHNRRSNRMNSAFTPPQQHESGRQTRAGHAKRISSARRSSGYEMSDGVSNSGGGGGAAENAASVSRGTRRDEAPAASVAVATKRGSRSSQGSSDSNSSTRSVGSGSLLLTAANLERFVEIHNRQQHNKLYLENLPTLHNNNTTKTATTTTYNSNLTHAMMQQHAAGGNIIIGENATNPKNNNNNDNDATIISVDPNLDFIKTKDLDTVSIASSMHFTMVNGEAGGSNKKPKRGLCDRGRQVTVLIVSMSTIFLLLIMAMVYALEMRAREMPQS